MTEETFSDVKNEINDSDLPDDLPSDVPTDQPKKISATAKKNINLFSAFKVKEGIVVFHRKNVGDRGVDNITFNIPIQEGNSHRWRDDAHFNYKK